MRFLSVILLMCAFVPEAAQAQAQIREVYLVQNSGWMEPFYTDSRSQFRGLIESLVEVTRLNRVPISIATFNQNGQIPGVASPNVVYSGEYSAADVSQAVRSISLPRRPNGKYADADFFGALNNTLKEVLQGEEGVIWMITNNKNSPDNDQDVLKNTQGFYDLLRNSDFITRIVAYPLRMKVTGEHFSESGFIIYGIAYGQTAARALDVLLGTGAPIHGLFNDPAVFLKPIAPESVELVLSMQEVGEGITAHMESGVLVIDDLPGSQENVVQLTGRLKNVAYPKRIATAQISSGWSGTSGSSPVIAADPSTIDGLAYGAVSDPVTFQIALPAVHRPAGLSGLLQSESVIDGRLQIALNNLDYDLDDAFVDKAAAVFGGDMLGQGQRRLVDQQLPDIFFDFRNVSQSVSEVPVRLIVRFSLLPLYGAVAILALILAGGGLLFWLRSHVRTATVLAGGMRQSLSLRPGQSVEVDGADGNRYRVTGRLLKTHSVSPLN
ncbi:hypothetical protein SAMN05428963_101252 [Consotaella salsifontis]|uniref:Uncharacterized protein n=2 Tax=Consotaella salsifontis TaxID=1365950 RepID=A0A1T4LKL5_9HYPH|nr:hypothetical protein SAMN05428963_101252 [Consotaella salsifontis]